MVYDDDLLVDAWSMMDKYWVAMMFHLIVGLSKHALWTTVNNKGQLTTANIFQLFVAASVVGTNVKDDPQLPA